MSTETIDDHITISGAVIERGYRSCFATSRKFYSEAAWMTANLPTAKRLAIAAVGWHLIRCLDFLDLESFDGLSLDVWKESLYELSDTLAGKCRTPQDAALADTLHRFKIPKEHLLAMMTAADSWIRTQQFETHDQLELFTAQFGGNMMAACVPILGGGESDHFTHAIQCGQAIQLTHMLANLVPNLKKHHHFYATDDVRQTGLSVTRTMMRQSSPPLKQFVRLQTARIEKLFIGGGQLISCLDFDGKRSLASLLDYYWTVFTTIRAHPDSILHPAGVLGKRTRLGLRTRHMLGTEGKSPIIGAGAVH